MKKILFLIPIILISGCNSSTKKEDIMLEYAKTYYTNHMIMITADNVSITKEMLSIASDEDGYDMSKLDDCSNSSNVVFTIEDREIKDVKYNLDCK